MKKILLLISLFITSCTSDVILFEPGFYFEIVGKKYYHYHEPNQNYNLVQYTLKPYSCFRMTAFGFDDDVMYLQLPITDDTLNLGDTLYFSAGQNKKLQRIKKK